MTLRRHRFGLLACVLAVAQLVATTAMADPTTAAPGTASQPSQAVPVKVVPILKGSTAPFSGLLVPEARFVEDLHRKVDNDELKYKLKLRTSHHEEDAKVWQTGLKACQQDLNKRAEPTPWYKSVQFWLPVGLIVGLAGGIAIYHGASELAHK